jgi:hypothetical protein
MTASLGVSTNGPVWSGSLDSLAGRQLKWVYPAVADDDEFLKRATLASTLVIDALEPVPLRSLLRALDKNLHMNNDTPPRPLGSRNLLQRVTLLAVLVRDFRPDVTAIPILIMQAEGRLNPDQPDLQAELERSFRRVRDELAPLAFLYDLRIHGGLARILLTCRRHPQQQPSSVFQILIGIGQTTSAFSTSSAIAFVELAPTCGMLGANNGNEFPRLSGIAHAFD